jgi:hypothetical protein
MKGLTGFFSDFSHSKSLVEHIFHDFTLGPSELPESLLHSMCQFRLAERMPIVNGTSLS